MIWHNTTSLFGGKFAGIKLAAVGFALAGVVAASSPAKADGFRFGINIGVPVFCPAPVYYAPPPVYYQPPQPVYSPPTYYQQAAPQYMPPQPVYVPPPVYCPPPAPVYYRPRPLLFFHTGWGNDGWRGRAMWRGGEREGGRRFQRFGGWHHGHERR